QSNHVTTRTVSDAFGTYLYFPRLLDPDLLEDAILSGFRDGTLMCEYFGYADAFDPESGKYEGLCTTAKPFSISIGESVLIKPDIATERQAAYQAEAAAKASNGKSNAASGDGSATAPATVPSGNGGGTG